MAAKQRDRLTVALHPSNTRYELLLDGSVVGFAGFSLHDSVVTIPHVETTPEHRGKDFAAQLMRGVLDDIRERGQTVRPVCPYASAYIQRHPETNDLLEHRD